MLFRILIAPIVVAIFVFIVLVGALGIPSSALIWLFEQLGGPGILAMLLALWRWLSKRGGTQ